MIRMLVIGYSFGIRSERRLCEEVHLNLAYRWFCRLGLEDASYIHHGNHEASRLVLWDNFGKRGNHLCKI